MRRGYLSEDFRPTVLFETTTISGRIALRTISEKWVEKKMEWIELA
jgi:hypothetical protein